MLGISDIHRINWSNVFLSGLVASIVVAITMLASGTNIVAALGGMLLGGDAGAGARYLSGGLAHLFVGTVYAIAFAVVFAPVMVWNRLTKGVVFGFVITTMALVFMPLGAQMLGAGGQAGANPCAPAAANPCAAKAANPCMAANPCQSDKTNPCNPCAAKSNPCGSANPCAAKMANPCGSANPCAAKMANPCGPANPCASGDSNRIKMASPNNPCAAQAANPCMAGNPCAPANPCSPGGGGNSYGGLISLINHLVFGLVLAFMIRLRPAARD